MNLTERERAELFRCILAIVFAATSISKAQVTRTMRDRGVSSVSSCNNAINLCRALFVSPLQMYLVPASLSLPFTTRVLPWNLPCQPRFATFSSEDRHLITFPSISEQAMICERNTENCLMNTEKYVQWPKLVQSQALSPLFNSQTALLSFANSTSAQQSTPTPTCGPF